MLLICKRKLIRREMTPLRWSQLLLSPLLIANRITMRREKKGKMIKKVKIRTTRKVRTTIRTKVIRRELKR